MVNDLAERSQGDEMGEYSTGWVHKVRKIERVPCIVGSGWCCELHKSVKTIINSPVDRFLIIPPQIPQKRPGCPCRMHEFYANRSLSLACTTRCFPHRKRTQRLSCRSSLTWNLKGVFSGVGGGTDVVVTTFDTGCIGGDETASRYTSGFHEWEGRPLVGLLRSLERIVCWCVLEASKSGWEW